MYNSSFLIKTTFTYSTKCYCFSTLTDACAVYPCHQNANCTNTDNGSYKCACRIGFYGDAVNNCTDINECNSSTVCGPNSVCTNTEGSFLCTCQLGFFRNSAGMCEDRNECASHPCHFDADCTNTKGSYVCECIQGFTGDGYQCKGEWHTSIILIE